MLVGIIVDVGLLLWQTARPHRRFVHAYAGRVALVDAARIAGISPEALRMHCRRTGRPVIMDATGTEELWLADVLTSLPHRRMRATVFVRAHAQPRPRNAPTQLEVLRWPIGIIWWLAVGMTTIVQVALNTAMPQFRASFTNVTALLLIVVLMALLWPLSVLQSHAWISRTSASASARCRNGSRWGVSWPARSRRIAGKRGADSGAIGAGGNDCITCLGMRAWWWSSCSMMDNACCFPRATPRQPARWCALRQHARGSNRTPWAKPSIQRVGLWAGRRHPLIDP